MTNRCQGILFCFTGISMKYQKKYCWVSQERILELIEKYQKLHFSKRTLNRDLRWLEDNGYISRLRRIRIGPDGKFLFCSTLYKFTGKFFNWLYSLGDKVKRLFSFFRVPKLAHHNLKQRQISSMAASASVENLLIKERDGTLSLYYPRSGACLRYTK